jgi:hypothetical protein
MGNFFLYGLTKERPHFFTPVGPLIIIDISKVIPIDGVHGFSPNNRLSTMALKLKCKQLYLPAGDNTTK